MLRGALVSWMVLLLAVVLQVTIATRVTAGPLTADLVTLAIAVLAVQQGSIRGAIYGFTGGLMLALSVAAPIGTAALLGCIVGYSAGRIGESIVTDEEWIAPVLAVAGGTIAVHLGVPIFGLLIMETGDGVQVADLMGSMIVNTLLAVPVFSIVGRMTGAGDGSVAMPTPPARARRTRLRAVAGSNDLGGRV